MPPPRENAQSQHEATKKELQSDRNLRLVEMKAVRAGQEALAAVTKEKVSGGPAFLHPLHILHLHPVGHGTAHLEPCCYSCCC